MEEQREYILHEILTVSLGELRTVTKYVFRSYILKTLGEGGKTVSMCCSTVQVLCDFQIFIISGIVRLAPITHYYL